MCGSETKNFSGHVQQKMKHIKVLNVSLFSHLPGPFCPDVDGNGFISASELGDLFREVGTPLPGFLIRELLQKLDRDKDSRIDFEEFTAVGNAN